MFPEARQNVDDKPYHWFENEEGKQMNLELVEAIGELSYDTKLIRRSTLQTIRENGEEASAFFLKRLDDLADDPMTKDDGLLNESFFGLFFLAEWKETAAFKKIQKILHLMGDNTDRWLGDALTENIPAILYQVYDGDYENLKIAAMDTDMESFSRTPFIDIIFQQYSDGEIGKDSLFELSDLFENEPEDDRDYIVITELCFEMARAHIHEYLPHTRQWFEDGYIDPFIAGDYPDYVDITFEKSHDEGSFISKDFNLEKDLHRWYEIEGWENKPGNVHKTFSDKQLAGQMHLALMRMADPYYKVGRNDLCPCGSGKKYKKCHLLKNGGTDKMDNGIESNQDRDKHLQHYPVLSFDPETLEDKPDFEREEGRLYLEDLYDRESIEIDHYVYLAYKQDNRAMFDIRSDAEKAEKSRIKKAYLEKARTLINEKMKKEGITDWAEYDRKFSIHFLAGEWTSH